MLSRVYKVCSSYEVGDGAVGEAHYIFCEVVDGAVGGAIIYILYSMYCIHTEERAQIMKAS